MAKLNYLLNNISKKNPLISIIIPTLNCGDIIDRAIRSVVKQKYSHRELIIVDGGSTDETINIINQNAQYITKWINEPDKGLYDAMNKGVKIANGDWIYFLGADDILVNCLHKVASQLKHPKWIYYGDVYLPEKNKVYSGRFKWHTLVSKNINHQSIFYPRQVFERYQYDLNYPILADYDLNLRVWGESQFKFKYIHELIAIHNGTGISNVESDELFQINKVNVITNYFGKRIAFRNNLISIKKKIRDFLLNHSTQ